MFTFIHIFGLNFLVEIRSAVFWMQMDLNLSFRCSIQVNAFSCNAIIKVLCAQPRFRPLTVEGSCMVSCVLSEGWKVDCTGPHLRVDRMKKKHHFHFHRIRVNLIVNLARMDHCLQFYFTFDRMEKNIPFT